MVTHKFEIIAEFFKMRIFSFRVMFLLILTTFRLILFLELFLLIIIEEKKHL